MKIAWYDAGYIHQSAGVPGLPSPEDVPFIFSPGLTHMKPNVIGCEMWRVPLFHALRDLGHDITMLTRRDIVPSEDLDFDLNRLAESFPEFAPFIRERDPMMDCGFFHIRGELTRRYWEERYANSSGPLQDDDEPVDDEDEPSAETTKMFMRWVKDRVFGEPPDADVAVIAAMRANVATGFEQGYLMACYIDRGTPVVIWDQDRQMTGVLVAFRRLGIQWPHPLVTVIAPYEETLKWGTPELIDYPYVDKYEREPLPVDQRVGAVYVGNDYERRAAMERLLLHLSPDTMPVSVYGKYDKKGNGTPGVEGIPSAEWKGRWPYVRWAGRVESNHVPVVVGEGTLTVNCVKQDYMKISLLTLRTFDSPLYGTLQIGDARVKRLARFVPPEYLADSVDDARAIARRIAAFTDEQYHEELERQRDYCRANNMTAFVDRFLGLLDDAISRKG